jgi:hypothetical protein
MWRLCWEGPYQGRFVQSKGRAAFNLLFTVPTVTDEKMSPSDAEPSKAEAAAGYPARRSRVVGSRG